MSQVPGKIPALPSLHNHEKYFRNPESFEVFHHHPSIPLGEKFEIPHYVTVFISISNFY
jgi:hypothetical protein